MKNINHAIIFFLGLYCGFVHSFDADIHSNKVDFVIFSYDRPLQLNALLESTKLYITGLGKTYVIYRASDDSYVYGYDIVRQAFPGVEFLKQGDNPHQDFKPLTLNATFQSPSQYIMFAVDDIVIKDYVNLSQCASYLEQTGAYGFYLRLGMNLSECYPNRCRQPVPSLRLIADDVYAWQLGQGRYCWGYPNTVDMTIYKKSDIQRDLESLRFSTPNSFESEWSVRSGMVMGRQGLCFAQSKIVNLPLNRVQNEFHNRVMNCLSPRELLDLFLAEKKMDIMPLSAIDNHAAHMEYSPVFVSQ